MEQARTEMKVMGVYAHQDQGASPGHFVLLCCNPNFRVSIFVGQFEAWAIAAALEGAPLDRPFTHDAMLNLLTLTGGVLVEVCINDLRDETFYAVGRVRVGIEVKEIDLRPSDAINLALRAKCPIFMADDVLLARVRTE